MSELDEVKAAVEHLLAEYPQARNNDLLLCLLYWQDIQKINCFIPYDKVSVMVTPESITRVRRKLQNEEKKYLPTDDKVIKRRKKREQVIEDWAVNHYPM